MHLGLILPNFGPDSSPAGIRRAAEAAEALGFDSIWTTEHMAAGAEGAVVTLTDEEAMEAFVTRHRA